MPGTTLIVKVVADTTQAAAKLKGAGDSTNRWAAGIRKAAIPAAALGVAALKGADMVIDAASEQQQAMGAVDSVFGKSAATIKGWAAAAADSVGLAATEYANMAAIVGAQLGNLGIPHDKVLGKTKNLIKMGADLAATYGGTTKEAVEALSSALRGETDPIERYAIGVKQADVNARMLHDGTDKLTGSAFKAAKTNALLALITGQGAKAAGQFARESDSLAGAQQRSAAQFENSKAAIGQALLPAMTALTSILAGVAKWAGKHPKIFVAIVAAVLALAAAIIILNVALAITNALAAPLVLPILAVVAGLALFIAAIVVLWKKNATFRAAVLKAWEAIKAAAAKLWAVIQDVFQTQIIPLWRRVAAAARQVWAVIQDVFQTRIIPLWRRLAAAAGQIAAAIGVAWHDLQPTFQEIWAVIRRVFGYIVDYYKFLWAATVVVVKAIIAVWRFVSPSFAQLVATVKFVVKAIIVAWRFLTPSIATVVAAVKILIRVIVATIIFMWAHFKNVITGIVAVWNLLRAAVTAVVGVIINYFRFLAANARALWNAIVAAGRGIIGVWVAIRNGIASAVNFLRTTVFGALKTAVNTLAAAFATAKNAILAAFRLVQSGIATIIGGIRSLFMNAKTTALDWLVNAFRTAKDTIVGIFNSISSAISGTIDTIKNMIQGLIDKLHSIPGVKSILGAVGLSAAPAAAPVPPAPMPRTATTHTRSTSTDPRSPANPLAGATFQLVLDGQVVERAVTKVTVAQNRVLARRILSGRPAQ
jgi:phage-related protein